MVLHFVEVGDVGRRALQADDERIGGQRRPLGAELVRERKLIGLGAHADGIEDEIALVPLDRQILKLEAHGLRHDVRRKRAVWYRVSFVNGMELSAAQFDMPQRTVRDGTRSNTPYGTWT